MSKNIHNHKKERMSRILIFFILPVTMDQIHGKICRVNFKVTFGNTFKES